MKDFQPGELVFWTYDGQTFQYAEVVEPEGFSFYDYWLKLDDGRQMPAFRHEIRKATAV